LGFGKAEYCLEGELSGEGDECEIFGGYLASGKPVYEARDLRGVVNKLDEVCRDLEF
jgi:hypothetical protein